jgi:hypothetical protein
LRIGYACCYLERFCQHHCCCCCCCCPKHAWQVSAMTWRAQKVQYIEEQGPVSGQCV